MALELTTGIGIHSAFERCSRKAPLGNSHDDYTREVSIGSGYKVRRQQGGDGLGL